MLPATTPMPSVAAPTALGPMVTAVTEALAAPVETSTGRSTVNLEPVVQALAQFWARHDPADDEEDVGSYKDVTGQ